MSTCQSCGGVIGRDCFNPDECAWITQQQANQSEANHYALQEVQNELECLKKDIISFIEQAIGEIEGGTFSDAINPLTLALNRLKG